jgi:hypothetical protein
MKNETQMKIQKQKQTQTQMSAQARHVQNRSQIAERRTKSPQNATVAVDLFAHAHMVLREFDRVELRVELQRRVPHWSEVLCVRARDDSSQVRERTGDFEAQM